MLPVPTEPSASFSDMAPSRAAHWYSVLLAVCAATLPAPAQSVEWSQWRGPAHDGVFPEETTWQTDWQQRSPRTLWKVEVGIGYSGVAISQDCAYTVGNADGRDTVYCLD